MEPTEVIDAPGSAIVIAKSDELSESGRIVVSVDGVEIGLFRIKGQLRAWANRCAHLGGPVCQGLIINRVRERLDAQQRSQGDYFGDERHVVCPWHGYEYDIETGQHPADAKVRLRSYPVFERDGDILVHL